MLKHLSLNSIVSFCKYISHNKKTFTLSGKKSKSKILVEYNALCDSHIVYSYLSNHLAKKYNCEINSYDSKFHNSLFRKVTSFIKSYLFFSYRKIYRSFGATEHISPEKMNDEFIERIKKKILDEVQEKKNIFEITIDNINIGDLIYDGFLRKFNLPTIDVKSDIFKDYLVETIDLFYFWYCYFNNNEIKAVIISHTVYEFGIILRVAIEKKIRVFSAGSYLIFSHDKDNQTIFDMSYYEIEFKKLSKELQTSAIKEAILLIEKKFSGEATIENKISALPEGSPFKKENFGSRILSKNNKKKILIAAHHFSDAPNVYGKFIFNDFYDWVDFLGKKSENTNYEWYIKFHPMEFKANKKTSEYFLKKYKNLNLIDRDISHSQLIHEGISLVLTVYGTIGLEYAYFGIPVINAANNNPHKAYNFNYHAKNTQDYNNAIDNFESLNLNYDKNQIYEYFYMRYLNSFYLFEDEIQNISNSIDYQSPLIYNKWLNYLNGDIDKNLKNTISKFVESKKFRCTKN